MSDTTPPATQIPPPAGVTASGPVAPVPPPRESLRPLDDAALQELLNAPAGDGPYLSLYLPTQRKGRETRENAKRFKNVCKVARTVLEASADPAAVNALARLGMIELLGDEYEFWQNQLDGLAVFSSASSLRMFRVGQELPERAHVADSFHVKPLIRILQAAGRYHLLAVTAKSVRLYEGHLNGLDEVPLSEDVPRSVIDALGGQVEGSLNVHSYGGLSYSGMFHGHHDSKDVRDKDRERYLRAVDRAIYDYHRRDDKRPLYLAADVGYHDLFNRVTHDPRATKKGIHINPEGVEINDERLRREVEAVIRPDVDAEIHTLVEQFGNAKAKGEGSDSLNAVAEAAIAGRILTLLVSADTSVGGHIDPATGAVTLTDENGADADDVLDDLCELVMKTGGKVRVLPGDKHPASSGVAAVYRY